MSGVDKFINLGIPQLPQVDYKNQAYQDIFDIFNALRALTQQFGFLTGLVPPLTSLQITANAQASIGYSKKRLYVPATVAVAYGELVHLFDNAGVLSGKLSNATNTTLPAHGICNTVGGVGVGDMMEVVLPGAYVDSVGGLTRGAIYYTSTTPGAMQTPKPAAAGNLVQAVGFAISPGELFFNLSYQWATA